MRAPPLPAAAVGKMAGAAPSVADRRRAGRDCGLRIVEACGDRDGTLHGAHVVWAAIIVAVGLLVIRWRWAYVTALFLLMLGFGGVQTLEKGATGCGCAAISASTPSPTIAIISSGGSRMARRCTGSSARRPATNSIRLPIMAISRGRPDARQAAQARRAGMPPSASSARGRALSCYRKAGQHWTIFEIDPVMADSARPHRSLSCRAAPPIRRS